MIRALKERSSLYWMRVYLTRSMWRLIWLLELGINSKFRLRIYMDTRPWVIWSKFWLLKNRKLQLRQLLASLTEQSPYHGQHQILEAQRSHSTQLLFYRRMDSISNRRRIAMELARLSLDKLHAQCQQLLLTALHTYCLGVPQFGLKLQPLTSMASPTTRILAMVR